MEFFRKIWRSLSAAGRRNDQVKSVPLIYTPKELGEKLRRLAGRKVFVDFQRYVDGPQTAARLVSETIGRNGMHVTEARSTAEVGVFIYHIEGMRFGFSISRIDGLHPKYEATCGPRELTMAIMSGVCEFFSQLDGVPRLPAANTMTILIAALDAKERKDSKAAQEHLVKNGNEALCALIESVHDLNRKITGNLLSGNPYQAGECMVQLARRIETLGLMRAFEALVPILDTLGDAAEFAVNGFPPARALRDTAFDAVCLMGPVAIPEIKRRLGLLESNPDKGKAIRQVALVLLERLGRGGSKA